ncbi:hypothetical protein ACFC1R_15065 [Kitasatospora sp. NPDC056138]|uniref:hypothetical protein n=1 Tax=Kitasatospora sp. NPDC056138 TaxID=3345724 RepID=UPI0035D6402F
MKKRSMLAVASLAVGVVASLTAPSAHAGPADAGTSGTRGTGVTAPDSVPLPEPIADGEAEDGVGR